MHSEPTREMRKKEIRNWMEESKRRILRRKLIVFVVFSVIFGLGLALVCGSGYGLIGSAILAIFIYLFYGPATGLLSGLLACLGVGLEYLFN